MYAENKKQIPKAALLIVTAMVMCCLLMGAKCFPHVTGIKLPESITVEKGESLWLDREYFMNSDASKEQIEKAIAKLDLVWTSSNSDVLIVDEKGNIKTLATGVAEITVVDKKGKITDTCKVKIIVSPTDIKAPESLDLIINFEDSKAINAEICPVDATDVKLIYKSSNENIAVVDEYGKVTAVDDGKCVITAFVVNTKHTDKVYDLNAATFVTVKTAPESIALDDISVTVGKAKELNVVTSPETVDMGNQFIWYSGDESILTVDENGNITAIKAGKATVTVTNELGQSAECVVTVKEPLATTVNDSTENKTAVDKAIARGASGRWIIPAVGINVATFNDLSSTLKMSQHYVDAVDSAAVFYYGTQLIIADHNYQGFDAIKSCKVGMKAYWDTAEGRKEYVCAKVFLGHNTRAVLTDSNYKDIYNSNAGGITCYTCNENARNITIVFFQPV